MLFLNSNISVLKKWLNSLVLRLKNLTPHEIFIVVVVVFIAFVISYTVYVKKELDPSMPIFEIGNNFSVDMITDPQEDSTAEAELEKLEILDERIEDAETTLQKLTFSFKKGVTLITQNNRTGASSLEAQREARQLFAAVYENSKNVPELKTTKEMALWGFLFEFVSISNGDVALILDGMPEEIKSAYFTDPEISAGGTLGTQKVFEGMIAFVDDTQRFSILRNDKSFNSYSAMLKAEYLDSFKNELTDEERTNLMNSIENDIREYESGIEITNRDSIDTLRTTSVAPTQVAFARFAITQAQDSNSTDTSSLTDVYEHIQSIQKIDGFGRAIVLSRIAFYELSALRRFESSEEQISLVVAKLQNLRGKYSELSPVLKRMLNDRLAPERQWNQVNKDLAELTKTSPSFKNLLTELGVQN